MNPLDRQIMEEQMYLFVDPPAAPHKGLHRTFLLFDWTLMDASSTDLPQLRAPGLLIPLVSCVGFVPKEEGMMHHSRGRYLPRLETMVINPVGEPHNNLLATPTHKITNTCTQRKQGVVNPLAV